MCVLCVCVVCACCVCVCVCVCMCVCVCVCVCLTPPLSHARFECAGLFVWRAKRCCLFDVTARRTCKQRKSTCKQHIKQRIKQHTKQHTKQHISNTLATKQVLQATRPRTQAIARVYTCVRIYTLYACVRVYTRALNVASKSTRSKGRAHGHRLLRVYLCVHTRIFPTSSVTCERSTGLV